MAMMRGLVADTSMVMRKVYVGALARAGIVHVDQTADGLEALRMLATEKYDIVVMDTNLKGLHGVDALRRLRSAGLTVPVVLVTAEGAREQVLEALRAGATAYVMKPVAPHVIVAKINEALARPAAPMKEGEGNGEG